MLLNYFKTAWRNLIRTKGYSLINIGGLAIGITAGFLILLYVQFELSYDTFHTKADRIYRLVSDVKTPTERRYTSLTSEPMAPTLKENFAEVENVVRIIPSSLLLRRGDVKFQEERSMFADFTLFSVFDFRLIHGNPNEALREPLSIVLSQSAAKKYFGNTNPVGQPIILSAGNFNATVTGIMKDMPENSQIKADLIVSMATTKSFGSATTEEQWTNLGYTSYLLLKPNANPKSLEVKFPAFLERYAKTEMRQNNVQLRLFLEPLKDVYIKSKRGGLESGNQSNVYVFSIIAVFILLIACINFINLTTARSAERAKEVGIKKVVGANRGQLAWQFMVESVLICLIAFVLSLFLCNLLLPFFNQLSGKVISSSLFSHPAHIITLFVIAVGIGILAGVYPALVLSSFMPITVLKGRFVSSSKGLILRKGLVVAQFTISIALIAATIIVYTQLHYMRNQDLGFRNDQIMVIDTHWDGNRFAFQQATAALPNVVAASLSSGIPGGELESAYIQLESKRGEMQAATLDMYLADFDFVSQYE
jgi:putative ABC transport system permease protein